MEHTNTYEPSSFGVYVQQALKPISRRYFYSSYVKSLPVNSTDHVLEYGSGIGVMAGMLARKLELGEITCVDVSSKYLTTARKNLKNYTNVTYHHGNLGSLDYKPDQFDAVNVHFVLHDVQKANRQMLVNQMFELLRPGGKVYLREPMNEKHGMSTEELKEMFFCAGFYPLYEEQEKVRMIGDVFTACYAKISTMRFFFS